jgi:acetate kinase
MSDNNSMQPVLALNCGSSSVRFAVFDEALQPVLRGHAENIVEGLLPRLTIDGEGQLDLPAHAASHATIVPELLETVILPRMGKPLAVGHRVVHGGTEFSRPALLSAATRTHLEELVTLAPLHLPHNLAGIDAVSAALPGIPQIACFDTAFHRTIPLYRQLMPLDPAYAQQGLKRYGFHGLSYQSIMRQLPEIIGDRSQGRLVICHLGNGCSLTGIIAGESQYTSMGFTPLDGLVMGSRPGKLDPGAVLWLAELHDGDIAAVRDLLNKRAGLTGISGISSDMRVLTASTDPRAEIAIAMFVDRLVQEIASAAAALGGIDALIFSGGIGENSAIIRERTLNSLSWLGFSINPDANAQHHVTISTGDSQRSAHIINTDEEWIIASEARQLADS